MKTAAFILSVILFWLWSFYRTYLSYTQGSEIESLEEQTEYVIEQHNKVNHELISASNRINELEEANEALVTHCTPASVVKAIKATPLPSIKG